MNATPSRLGYRMPAEWEPHAATWLTWPRPEGISFPGAYEPIPGVYARLCRLLTAVEEVHVNVWDAAMEEAARQALGADALPAGRLIFHHFPSYEPWCRDHGPVFVVRDAPGGRRERAVVDWDYNAWGGKYPPCDLDDAVPRHAARYRGLPLFTPGIVMEGGSIDVNGRGTLLTTESCLLNPNRNPSLTKGLIESYLKEYLGAANILWLGDGISGDDTDGHVDDLARFTDARTVAAVLEEDPSDADYGALQENFERLKGMRDEEGRPLRVVALPTPGPIEREGQRLPASYANFYIANEMVVVPTFNRPNDAKALGILQELFPSRRVVGLDSSDLIWGLGSFHCISQQEPADRV